VTIVATVKVRDGVVLASDSMTMIQVSLPNPAGGTQVVPVKTYQHARKLFRVGQSSIGVLTWGVGSLGPRSVESFMLDVSRSAKAGGSVQDAANLIVQTVGMQYQQTFGQLAAADKPEMGFLIAGYSPKATFAEEWQVVFPNATVPTKIIEDPDNGSVWRGMWFPFTRLYNGMDPRMPGELKQALATAGVNSAVADPLVDQVLGSLPMPVYYDGMPVQDAIDLARFILDTTISVARFEAGTAVTCGGPLQVAAILPDVGWQWVQEPKLHI
jgi:hypothetical protein